MSRKAERLQEMANKAAGSTARGRAASSFLPTLFVIFSLVVAVVAICVKVIFSRRKVEKMMSKMRLADEDKIQALEDEKLAESTKEQLAARMRVRALEEEVNLLREQVQDRRRGHAELVRELQAVVNWDDLEVVDAREDS